MSKTFQTRDRALSVILEDKTNRDSQGTDTFLSSANSFDHAPKILAGIISLSPTTIGDNNAHGASNKFAFRDDYSHKLDHQIISKNSVGKVSDTSGTLSGAAGRIS